MQSDVNMAPFSTRSQNCEKWLLA